MPIIGSFAAASKSGFGRGGGSTILSVDYLVIAGGGGGGGDDGGGGGGGGMRTSFPGGTKIDYEKDSTITIGAGGSGQLDQVLPHLQAE